MAARALLPLPSLAWGPSAPHANRLEFPRGGTCITASCMGTTSLTSSGTGQSRCSKLWDDWEPGGSFCSVHVSRAWGLTASYPLLLFGNIQQQSQNSVLRGVHYLCPRPTFLSSSNFPILVVLIQSGCPATPILQSLCPLQSWKPELEAVGAGGDCSAQRKHLANRSTHGGKSGTELLSDSSALLGAQLPTIHSAMLRKDWTAGVTAPHSTGCRYSPLGSRYCLPR